jgi:ketosteroid isomerase-like protein
MMSMTQTAKLFCLGVALAVLGIEVSAADSPKSKDVEAMHAVDQAWLKAYNGADADTLASLYDEHALLMPPGAPGVNGRSAIHAFFKKDVAASAKEGIVFGLGPKPDGGVSGDMGWVSGTYVVKDKSGKVVDTGKYLSVSMKKGGKWLYLRDTWNSDGAQPAADSAAAPKK